MPQIVRDGPGGCPPAAWRWTDASADDSHAWPRSPRRPAFPGQRRAQACRWWGGDGTRISAVGLCRVWSLRVKQPWWSVWGGASLVPALRPIALRHRAPNMYIPDRPRRRRGFFRLAGGGTGAAGPSARLRDTPVRSVSLPEAAAVIVTLVPLGEWLELRARHCTRRGLRALLSWRQDRAARAGRRRE